MVSKRGMLAVDEIIKLVLGVAVFIFILFLGYSFVKTIIGNHQEEQAMNTLERIVYEVNKGVPGEEIEFLIESPSKWMFVAEGNKICACPASKNLFPNLDERKKLSLQDVSKGVFNKCSSKNICVTVNKNIHVPGTCAIGSAEGVLTGNTVMHSSQCLYVDRVPKEAVLQFYSGGFVTFFLREGRAGAGNIGSGLQNENCMFPKNNLLYKKEISYYGSDQKIDNLAFNFSNSNCRLDLLAASHFKFYFTCTGYDEPTILYYFGDSPEFNDCSITNLDLENSLVNFSCVFKNPNSMSFEGDSTFCDIKVLLEFYSVETHGSALEGFKSRRLEGNWNKVPFVLPKLENASCNIFSISHKITDKSLQTSGGTIMNIFSVDTDCRYEEFGNFLKKQIVAQKYNDHYKFSFYKSGGSLVFRSIQSSNVQVLLPSESYKPSKKNSFEIMLFDRGLPEKGDYYIFIFDEKEFRVDII